jgi:hypothetical protein
MRTAHLKEKLAKLASELQRLKAIEQEMLASPDQQISLTDPDSRSMATSGRGSGVVGYEHDRNRTRLTLQRDDNWRGLREDHVGAQPDQFFREHSHLIRAGGKRKAVVNTDVAALRPSAFFKTARALGITVPPTLLARADEVIE